MFILVPLHVFRNIREHEKYTATHVPISSKMPHDLRWTSLFPKEQGWTRSEKDDLWIHSTPTSDISHISATLMIKNYMNKTAHVKMEKDTKHSTFLVVSYQLYFGNYWTTCVCVLHGGVSLLISGNKFLTNTLVKYFWLGYIIMRNLKWFCLVSFACWSNIITIVCLRQCGLLFCVYLK